MIEHRMPPIRITYENKVRRPTAQAEAKARRGGIRKAVAVQMAERMVEALAKQDQETWHIYGGQRVSQAADPLAQGWGEQAAALPQDQSIAG